MTPIETAIETCRALIRAAGGPRAAAKAAGLGYNTLCEFHRSDWSPTARTLRRLERTLGQAQNGEAA